MKRFYKTVEIDAARHILLDGRTLRTPLKKELSLPTQALADAVADEWRAQGDKVVPATMPLTKLANTAVDRVAPERARILQEIADFAGSDLVCYRADSPEGLVLRQDQFWNPVVDWATDDLKAPFITITGVIHRRQPEAAIAAIAKLAATASDFELTAIHNVMTLTGSALLSLMLWQRRTEEDTVWSAAHADEDYQIEQWGWDEEARELRVRRHQEFLSCVRFLDLLRA